VYKYGRYTTSFTTITVSTRLTHCSSAPRTIDIDTQAKQHYPDDGSRTELLEFLVLWIFLIQ
jgi:hypothetical protein